MAHPGVSADPLTDPAPSDAAATHPVPPPTDTQIPTPNFESEVATDTDTNTDAPQIPQTSTPPPSRSAASKPEQITEEVEVFGTRRGDSAWEVPISSIELEGLVLQQRDIVDLTTLSDKVLTFFHSESIVSSDRFFIRGLGTIGTNPGFDQAVGLSIDGLSLARSRFGRTTFLDLSSVVIYKGSVNEAGAKNSPAGRLELHTTDAEPDFRGYVNAFQNFASSPGTSIDAASNFRLSDTWAMRLATRLELRDGWVENPSIGESGQQKRDWTLRAKWNGRLERNREMEIMYQLGVLNREGRNRELQGCLAERSGDDCTLDRSRHGVPTRQGGTGIGIEFFDTNYHLLTFEYLIPSERSLTTHLLNTAIYSADDYYDADQSFVRQDHSLVSTKENYTQLDYEYRWETQRDHWFNFRLATHISFSSVDFVEATVLCGDEFNDNGRLVQRANCDDSSQFEFQGAQRNVDVQLIELNAIYHNQFDFQLSPAWRIELATRFSLISKIVDGRSFLSDPWRPDSPLTAPRGGDFLSCSDYVLAQEIDEGNGRSLVCHAPLAAPFNNLNYGSDRHIQPYLWQPSLSLIWSDRAQKIYFRASRSVKSFGYEFWPITSGLGFNIIDGLSPLFPNQYRFRGEFTTTYEFGGNHSLAREKILLEWSAWLSLIRDLQVSNYDSFLQHQRVENVGSASSRGFDFEISYVFVPSHRLTVSAAFTLARYDDYTTAPCYENQSIEAGCLPVDRTSEFFDLIARTQDLSDAPLEYAPRWQYALTYDGTIALTNDWEMSISTSYFWRSEYFIGNSHHPIYDLQDPIGTVDARLAFSSSSWEIALLGRNLTASHAASFSTSDAAHERISVLGEPSIRIYTAFTRPGREISLNVKYLW